MNQGSAYGWVLSGLLALVAPQLAEGRSLQVPREHPTVQAAVDAAADGDRIVVGRGRFCGATIDKRLDLVGVHGATIIGCADPVIGPGLRAGFFLPDARASGTRIRGFRFDGRGVSNANLLPLALGVLARQVDRVEVTDNEFLGIVQAVTNTDGSGWRVLFNRIEDLTALTCDGLCTGGDGIVFQQRLRLDVRPKGNVAAFNRIEGRIPDGLDEFSFAGIFVLGQEGAFLLANRLAIPDNPAAAGEGDGILVTDQCCASVVVSTSIGSRILFNEGQRSEVAVRIAPDAQGGLGNLEDAKVFGNRGRVELPPGAPVHRWLWRLDAVGSLLLRDSAAAAQPARAVSVIW
jgi:hypothetical protein